jgi:hypothetical protein
VPRGLVLGRASDAACDGPATSKTRTWSSYAAALAERASLRKKTHLTAGKRLEQCRHGSPGVIIVHCKTVNSDAVTAEDSAGSSLFASSAGIRYSNLDFASVAYVPEESA